MSEPEEIDDDKITCWCGAVGTADELFGADVYWQSCEDCGLDDDGDWDYDDDWN